MMSIGFICNYIPIACDSSLINPPSTYYLRPGACTNNEYVIDPGNFSFPRIQTVTFPASMCPCTPTEFIINGVGFQLIGNNFFDDNHTWQHLGVIGGCCGAGINVSWDPVNCIITLIPSCP
ncbi:MAG: hypothetical protein IT243_10575 [Bacteroidia bacterium]|nr:hypothetical protein [Bacteroidia bacterium]